MNTSIISIRKYVSYNLRGPNRFKKKTLLMDLGLRKLFGTEMSNVKKVFHSWDYFFVKGKVFFFLCFKILVYFKKDFTNRNF